MTIGVMGAHPSEAHDRGVARLIEALDGVRFLENDAEVREWTRFDAHQKTAAKSKG